MWQKHMRVCVFVYVCVCVCDCGRFFEKDMWQHPPPHRDPKQQFLGLNCRTLKSKKKMPEI